MFTAQHDPYPPCPETGFEPDTLGMQQMFAE
jgi:hypothetical protein